jgi:hypothetical protein
MKSIVRKLSVGGKFPDGAIHYQVGNKIKLNGELCEVVKIIQDVELLSLGKLAYNIYISDSNSTLLWKTPVDLPFVVEHNITFK